MELYQQLQQLFKFRILSNAEIPAYLKRMMNAGKFDGPKQLAIMVMLLERVAALEEKQGIDPYSLPATSEPSWIEVRAKARELGVFKPGLKREELEALIASKSVV